MRLERLGADGAAVRTEDLDRSSLFTRPEVAGLRLTATLTPDQDGDWTLGLTATGPGRLWVDDVLVVDDPAPQPGGTLLGQGSREARGTVALRAGAPVTVRAEARQAPGLPLAGLGVGALAPQPPDLLERAVAAAAAADAAVVVVGTGEQWESEGADREAFALPGEQDELGAGWPRCSRGRSSSSPPARRWTWAGPTASRRSCSRGSPGRRAATPWPTSSSATPSPAAGCP